MRIRSHVSRAMARERLDPRHASVGLYMHTYVAMIIVAYRSTQERYLRKGFLKESNHSAPIIRNLTHRLYTVNRDLSNLRFTFFFHIFKRFRVIHRLSHLSRSESQIIRPFTYILRNGQHSSVS